MLRENADYIVDTAKSPGVIAPPYNSMWKVFTPWPSSAILIRHTSGFAADSVFWQADGRTIRAGMRRLIADQIDRLLGSCNAFTGFHSMRFTDGVRWWKYEGNRSYALGTSLCYRRDWWNAHRFPAIHVGGITGSPPPPTQRASWLRRMRAI